VLGKVVGESLEGAACLVRELAGRLAHRAQRAAGGHDVKKLLEPHRVESPLVEQRVTLAVFPACTSLAGRLTAASPCPFAGVADGLDRVPAW